MQSRVLQKENVFPFHGSFLRSHPNPTKQAKNGVLTQPKIALIETRQGSEMPNGGWFHNKV